MATNKTAPSKTTPSKVRQELESLGWRFMGFNAQTRKAYYANLNLPTTKTFSQAEALELSTRLTEMAERGDMSGIAQILFLLRKEERFYDRFGNVERGVSR